MKRLIPLLCGLVALVLLPKVGSATTFTSSTYYVAYEDLPSGTCDCDYNDLILSVTGTGLHVTSSGTFNNMSTANLGNANFNNTTKTGNTSAFSLTNPFWNNQSTDGTNEGAGWCMYSALNKCGPAGTGGSALTPINTTAQFLSNAGLSVSFAFTFTTGGAHTIDLTHLNGISGNAGDETQLWICPTGVTLSTSATGTTSPGTGCASANVTSGSAAVSVTGTSFDLVEYTPATTGRGATAGIPYSSTTSDPGTSDTSINHFALFASSPVSSVPEPATLGVVGLALLSLAGLHRRRKKSV
jgi:hypothetical protein